MVYLMLFALSVSAYCFISDEIKFRKREKRHRRGDVLEFN